MDFNEYTDEQLNDLRISILTEQERRRNLAAIPKQIAELSKAFRTGGGSDAVLQDAIEDRPEPEGEPEP